MRRHAEISVAALHDNCDPSYLRAVLAYDIDDFAHRKARRNDVFNDKCAILGRQHETTTQRRDAVFFLDENRVGAELARNLVAKHYAADRRADDDRRFHRTKRGGNLLGHRFHERRAFKNAKLLYERVAVAPRTQTEMATQERATIAQCALKIELRQERECLPRPRELRQADRKLERSAAQRRDSRRRRQRLARASSRAFDRRAPRPPAEYPA